MTRSPAGEHRERANSASQADTPTRGNARAAGVAATRGLHITTDRPRTDAPGQFSLEMIGKGQILICCLLQDCLTHPDPHRRIHLPIPNLCQVCLIEARGPPSSVDSLVIPYLYASAHVIPCYRCKLKAFVQILDFWCKYIRASVYVTTYFLLSNGIQTSGRAVLRIFLSGCVAETFASISTQTWSQGVLFICFNIDHKLLFQTLTDKSIGDGFQFYTTFYNAPLAVKVGGLTASGVRVAD